MSAIVLLDTSVFLNVLDVPGFNQDRDRIFEQFETMVNQGDYLLLPMATIWETGNHIARLPNGSLRREYAEIFVKKVEEALNGEAPFRATYFPDTEQFMEWLREFPDRANRSKSVEKPNEGTSLSDLSIVKEWEINCKWNSMSRVWIWSLDSDLASYDSGLNGGFGNV